MLASGIAFAAGTAALHLLPALPPVALAALAPAAAWAGWRRRPLRPIAAAVLGFLWALVAAHGTLAERLAPQLEGRDLRLSGAVAAPPVCDRRRCRFELAVGGAWRDGAPVPVPRRVRLSWYGRPPPLVPGQWLELRVRLRRPHGLANPGGFDYERWLAVRRIGAVGYVREALAPSRCCVADPVLALHRWRAEVAARVRAAVPDADASALVAALAVGVRSGLGDRHWRVLQATGTGHLMAISGLHVGIVAGLVLVLVQGFWGRLGVLALRVPAPVAAAWAALAAGAVYAAVAGFSLPTRRALVMLAAVLVGRALRRPLAPGRALGLALLAVLALDPLAPLAAGAWLSFAAVAVLAMAAPGPRRARSLLRVQLALTVGLAPLLAAAFGQLSWIAPVANLVAVPWVGAAVVPAALLGTVLELLGVDGDALFLAAGLFLAPLWALLEAVAAVPGGVVTLPDAPLWTWAMAAAGVAGWLLWRGLPGRWPWLLALLPLAVPPPAPVPGTARVTVLDVGQGLAVVVETARHVLVYDTGPRMGPTFDAGAAAVVPYLRSRGLRRVDRVVVSHPDSDHAGGLASLLATFPVARVDAAEPARIAGARACLAGQTWHWDGVGFEYLWPPAPGAGNDASCVLRIEATGGAVLLSGDIERRTEERLVRDGAPLRADVLVAPHHGSATSSSSAFVAAVAPRAVIFSVGYRNRYRFPRPEVTQRYRAAGAAAWSTAAAGAVEIRLSTDGVHVSGWRSEWPRWWRDTGAL